ncbi:hypothetical protein [Crenothrix sp.]|uniref:hypothetical protein n=1 Tax=Crenothrix sp. TaxID=3100433 RepID=UPI00374CBACF
MGKRPLCLSKMAGLAIFLAISSNAFAEDINYRIGLIVFAQNLPSSETFNQSKSQIEWPTTALLSELSSFKSAHSTLTDTVNALAKNPLYQPLLHGCKSKSNYPLFTSQITMAASMALSSLKTLRA